MKILLLSLLTLLFTQLIYAQVLYPQPDSSTTYNNFYNSYYNFNQNYFWYNPYYQETVTKEDYYKQFNERVKEDAKNGLRKKIDSSECTVECVVPSALDILYKVPSIGHAPANECLQKDPKPTTRENHPITRLKPKLITKITPADGFNKKCQNFIKNDGQVGPWGEYIKDYISKNKKTFLNKDLPGMSAIPKTCPMWRILSEENKTRFWIWMFASIAQVESSCQKSAVNKGKVPNPTDRPRGLLQLNTLRKARYWRGENCKFPSDVDSVTTPKNQILCGLDIMNELLKGKEGMYKSNGKIFPTNSYWEKLRSNHSSTGGPIGELSRKFKPCGAAP